MKDLFYSNNTPLFDTLIDNKRNEDSEEFSRRITNWKNDFIETFCTTPHGRRVLWFLIHETYVFRKYLQHNASAYALEGKRELGQDIIDLIGSEEVLQSLIRTKKENQR